MHRPRTWLALCRLWPRGSWRREAPALARPALRPTLCAPPLLMPQALTALGCMEHRGACSADDVSGDGAGIMTKVPWALFKAEMPQLKEENTGCAPAPAPLARRAAAGGRGAAAGRQAIVRCCCTGLPPGSPGARRCQPTRASSNRSVGMLFIPNDDALEARCKEIMEGVAKAENFKARSGGLPPARRCRRVPAGCGVLGAAVAPRRLARLPPAGARAAAGGGAAGAAAAGRPQDERLTRLRAWRPALCPRRWWAGARCPWTRAWWAPSPSRPCPASARCGLHGLGADCWQLSRPAAQPPGSVACAPASAQGATAAGGSRSSGGGGRALPAHARPASARAAPRGPCAPQVFIESNAGLAGEELERELFIVRKLMEKEKVRVVGAGAGSGG